MLEKKEGVRVEIEFSSFKLNTQFIHHEGNEKEARMMMIIIIIQWFNELLSPLLLTFDDQEGDDLMIETLTLRITFCHQFS